MDLTNEQAQQLFDAGGFIIITDLPEGSEFGIDGTYHVTRRFSGLKFVPPGLHLISISTLASSHSGPSAIPIRTAYVRVTAPRQRIVLHYDKETENVIMDMDDEAIISDDHLRNLDKELAAYPFDGLAKWKRLTNHIDKALVHSVIGPKGRVDGMMSVDGEEEGVQTGSTSRVDSAATGSSSQEVNLRFPQFRLKRSWRDGAVGEEVTRYSKDKSWLLGHIISTQLDNNPVKLLGHLQLAFILLLHLSSYAALLVYKRLVPLLTRSSSYLTSGSSNTLSLYKGFVQVLSAQLTSLPDGVFETELPELDLFFMDEMESLRLNLSAFELGAGVREGIAEAWKELQKVTNKWKWGIADLDTKSIVNGPQDDSEDEDEEGEYAPVVVDI